MAKQTTPMGKKYYRRMGELSPQFLSLFSHYFAQDDVTSQAAVSAKRELQDYPAFQYVTCKWNTFPFSGLNLLRDIVLNETWSASHSRIHRLYEIGHFPLLHKVLGSYLIRSLRQDDPQLPTLESSSLYKWVSYCLDNLSLSSSISSFAFQNFRRNETDHERLLAIYQSTSTEKQELAVILASLLGDWDLVLRFLQGRDFRLEFYRKIMLYFGRPSHFSKAIKSKLCAKINELLHQEISDRAAELISYERERTIIMIFVKTNGYETNWKTVKKLVTFNSRPGLINFVCHTAAIKRDWDVVRSLFFQCSEICLLSRICLQSVKAKVWDVALQIFRFLIQTSQPPAIFSYFIHQVLAKVEDEDSVKNLLTVSAMLGMSTHYVFHVEFDELMSGGEPLLKAKLVQKINLVSDSDCYELIQQSGWATDECQQFLEEMKEEGTRNLMDVCRLAISHRIGFQAEREERIDALPFLRPPAKALLSFLDLDFPFHSTTGYCSNRIDTLFTCLMKYGRSNVRWKHAQRL